jgi:hypothetical protein
MEEHLTPATAAEVNLPFTPTLRPAVPDDLGFIFSTWLKHYKQHSHLTRDVTNKVFFVRYHRIIERLLARSLTVVAHPDGKPSVILGYSVMEPPIIHWVYVKGPWRRFGIGRLLLGGQNLDGCTFTHWTNDIEAFRGRWPNAVYDPYAV